VFSFDLVIPLGAGLSFFYLIPVVLLELWFSPKQFLAVLGIAAFPSILLLDLCSRQSAISGVPLAIVLTPPLSDAALEVPHAGGRREL
jgi:hypothetical protein